MAGIRKAIATRNSQRSTRSADDIEYDNKDGIELTTTDDSGIETNYHSFSEKVSSKVKSFRSLRERPSETSEDDDDYDYRGFNTSIADMYRYPDKERVDCCSIACFGCLQADRNRQLESHSHLQSP